MVNHNRTLILAPHTDDGEFGCGGSIAKFLEDSSIMDAYNANKFADGDYYVK